MTVLFRAIVSLPDHLCQPDRPIQDRIVFFEAPSAECPGAHLIVLLGFAWVTDTTQWLEDGLIYNISNERELLGDHAVGEPTTGDIRLFETGCGGDWAIHYAQPADVDLYVSPPTRLRLSAGLAKVPAQARPMGPREG